MKAAVGEPINDERVRLRGGRSLAYAEWGDKHGSPVFFFHGAPGSRLWCPDEGATRAAGVRLIAVDRPGFGRSTLQTDRRLEDWPLDVVELADALGLERFAVAGFSAGGPYALACAALIADRVTRAGLVGTTTRPLLGERLGAIAPRDDRQRRVLELLQHGDREAAAEQLAADEADWTRTVCEDPQRFFDPFPLNDQNRWFREDPARLGPFLRAVGEALRQGSAGLAWERVVQFEPCPFALDGLSVDIVIWHGRLDVVTSYTAAELLAARIPNRKLTIWPDEGHLGIARHWDEILEALAV